jgi:peptidyl-dipeptidase A
MKVRVVAGLGMTLLAAGLLVIYFAGNRSGDGLTGPGRSSDPGLPRAAETGGPGPAEVDTFLARYNRQYRQLWTGFEGTSWTASVDINEANSAAHVAAAGEMADFVGSRQTIEQLRLLRGRLDLTGLQDRQVEVAWQLAAHYPATAAAAVQELIATEAVLTDSLYAFRYRLEAPGQDPRLVTPNDLDEILIRSRDLDERLAAWECSKKAGPVLKDGLVKVRDLRNTVAREMGYTSFFDLETADYGLSAREMVQLTDELLDGIMPLYRQLHCWARHELAARYGVAEAPTLIPAHWLGNRYGQSWPGLVQGIDLDAMFRDVQPRWVIEQAERFYTSLGFAPLPATFWERSDLFELPAADPRRKNTHASAWHIDLDQDVRSLMSVKSNFDWFSTTHHELGHVYYYLAYSNEDVPYILRRGANRAFHEGIGTLAELASNQVPYLRQVGLLAAEEAPEEIRWLLTQALQGPVVFLPFACGTMTHWEYDLYQQDLPRHQFNTRWWEHAARYQGIAPPAERGEDHCDPATKTHVIDDPAQYYDYALSSVILHQLHRHICREILDQDVRAANYYGNLKVGRFLRSILQPGATRDWAVVMRQATGEDLNSQALLEYYAPLQEWLEKQNEGRQVGF